MKKAMMALAALCVAGAASAVTISWGGSGEGATQPSTLTASSVAITAQFTVTQIDGANSDAAFLMLQDKNADYYKNHIRFGMDSNGVVHVLGNADKIPTFGTFGSELSSGDSATYSVKITITDGSGGNNALTIQWATVTGGVVGEYADISFADGARHTLPEDDYAVVLPGAPGVTIGTEGIAVQAIPEPTALALLALGVAGLALRRKAA